MKRFGLRLGAPLGALLFAIAGCQDGQPVRDVAAPAEGEPLGLVAGSASTSSSAASGLARSTADNGIEVIVTQANNVLTIKTTFEGGDNAAEIYPESGNEIPGSGMRFPGWLTIIDADAGGSGNFANEPSPETIAFWLIREDFSPTSREVFFNDAVSGVSFSYTSSVPVILDAFDASGEIVATASGPANVPTEAAGDPTGDFAAWDPLGVDAGENVITRVRITGNQNQSGFDDFTVTLNNTKRVPAGEAATVTVEEPCTAEPDGQCARAGADIKEGTFNDDVDLTVSFRQVQPGDPCHGTLFGQTGRCLEVTAKIATGPNAGQDAQLQKPITIIACPPGGNKAGLGFFKFEDDQGRPVALKEVDESISNCEGFLASAAESSWLKRFAMGVVKRAGRLFGPEPLQAALFNRGVGHDTPDGDNTLSHFTWASEIQVSTASLAVNVKNSGKDAFGVAGVFDLEAPLSSASPPPLVTVSFGDGGAALPTLGADDVVQTLSTTVCPTSFSRGCWRLSFGRWVWSAPTGSTTGILAMSIKADGSGEFSVGGAVPNTGLRRGTPTFRAFSLQIGTRTQGVGLECAADGKCTVHD